MAVIRKKSVVPYYLAAIVWVLAGLMAPMYDIKAFAIAAAFSLAAFFLGRKFIPDTEVHLPDPPVTTGDPELDELLKLGDGALAQMRTLNDAIADPTISKHIDELESLTGQIIQEVARHPEKKSQIRRFLDYYLPTTLKILGTYETVAGIQGENASATRSQIEGMMEQIVTAFRNQLDALFRDVTIDIASDIRVMEQLIAQEGLGGTGN